MPAALQELLGRHATQIALALTVILLSGCLVKRGPALPTTYYVATNGDDSNPGTEAAPFQTIARGSRALAAGDALLIKGGIYAEAMVNRRAGFVFRNGVSASAMTRYSAYPGETVVIQPPSGKFVLYFGNNAYIEVNGLVLDGGNTSSYVVRFGEASIHQIPHHIRLLNNEIKYGRMGIACGGETEIVGNTIHHMTGYGIYTCGDNGLIEGNIFHDIAGYALHHFQQHKTVNNWIIRNNIFFRNGREYTSKSTNRSSRPAPAVIISRGRNNHFYNNILYDNYAGVQVGLGAVDALVAHNTVYGNDVYGIGVDGAYAGSQNARIINNIAWGNMFAQVTDTGTNTILMGNVIGDPNFVNAPEGDFHLQAGSPAIDAGVALHEVSVDMAGSARPSGAASDAGAFEYVTVPGSHDLCGPPTLN